LLRAVALASACVLAAAPAFSQETAQALYSKALALERTLVVSPSAATAAEPGQSVKQFRQTIAAYEEVVRRYPRSGYCDHALWQAAQLALQASRRFGQDRDRQVAARLLRMLVKEYPSSPLVPEAKGELARLDGTPPGAPAPPPAVKPVPQERQAASAPPLAGAAARPAGANRPLASLRNVRRTVMPETIRITLELDREVVFTSERIENPPRAVIDLQDTLPSPAVVEGTLTYGDDLVRTLRVGRRPGNVTRVVLEIQGIGRYSVFTLYNPFRLVVDCERTHPGAGTIREGSDSPIPLARIPASPLASHPLGHGLVTLPRLDTLPLPALQPQRSAASAPGRSVVTPAGEKAVPPATNVGGGFSLARQLGLGVSHVVIDPGHGGHDPGAKGAGITEAAVVLDIALRLEALLTKEGVAVTLTRRGNDYVPLEDRTAIANQAQADLFLSIHANASRNPQARGVESYFLNFATNPDAEAVAAFENAASDRTMTDLADILKRITLNTKISESRDFATRVQESMAQRLRPTHRTFKDLGVKQAPFVVLIEATMPSALVEVSFITHGEEGRLLRNGSYRQRIAEALLDGIRHYQASLKSAGNASGR
jgi:N-acetylmuramoyl-L-alanine amidase